MENQKNIAVYDSTKMLTSKLTYENPGCYDWISLDDIRGTQFLEEIAKDNGLNLDTFPTTNINGKMGREIEYSRQNFFGEEDYAIGKTRVKFVKDSESADIIIVNSNSGAQNMAKDYSALGKFIVKYGFVPIGKMEHPSVTPSDLGVSIDAPYLDNRALCCFLKSSEGLEGILDKNKEKIERVVREINENLPAKIILTDYFKENWGK